LLDDSHDHKDLRLSDRSGYGPAFICLFSVCPAFRIKIRIFRATYTPNLETLKSLLSGLAVACGVSFAVPVQTR
jgi:hypothetical protein